MRRSDGQWDSSENMKWGQSDSEKNDDLKNDAMAPSLDLGSGSLPIQGDGLRKEEDPPNTARLIEMLNPSFQLETGSVEAAKVMEIQRQYQRRTLDCKNEGGTATLPIQKEADATRQGEATLTFPVVSSGANTAASIREEPQLSEGINSASTSSASIAHARPFYNTRKRYAEMGKQPANVSSPSTLYLNNSTPPLANAALNRGSSQDSPLPIPTTALTAHQTPKEGLYATTPIISSVTPLENDVKLGRGRHHRDHPGNKRMQLLVDLHREAYCNADREGKMNLSRGMVQIMKAQGTRFLKYDKGSTSWQQVSDEMARLKIGHAIRDGRSRPSHAIDPHIFVQGIQPELLMTSKETQQAVERMFQISNSSRQEVSGGPVLGVEEANILSQIMDDWPPESVAEVQLEEHVNDPNGDKKSSVF